VLVVLDVVAQERMSEQVNVGSHHKHTRHWHWCFILSPFRVASTSHHTALHLALLLLACHNASVSIVSEPRYYDESQQIGGLGREGHVHV
jgi:hypothetical protein